MTTCCGTRPPSTSAVSRTSPGTLLGAEWKVGRGGGSHAVQLMLSHTEEQLFETDEKTVI
ncbi:hypothetical protein [Streptomyces sp. YS415]|uniref:hypothetical protein n=1 Tax=Streptomyces sp. YS415 TaxID=2944806 RepID=UPI002021FD9E|nr:hypothetical protein [Streptomyces sp. YS415]MCL7429803.1 hypothetical protein [Streptomyces sp. YS415]